MDNRFLDRGLTGRRILLIAVPALGDVLLCTPLLRALRAAARARIDVLLRKGHAGVLDGNPNVGRIIQLDKHPSMSQHMEMLRRLLRAYDVVVSNSTSDRMAFYALAAAPRRISVVPPYGHGLRWKRWLAEKYTVVDAEHCHTLITIRRLGALLGLAVDQRITPPSAHNSDAALNALLGPDWDNDNFAVVHPTPASPYKRWHIMGWRLVAQHLRNKGFRVIVTGGPSVEELDYVNHALRLPKDSVTNLAGKLRLGDISSLLERCSIFVGVDTVVTHLAASLGAPTIALFGPTNPLVWGPWPRGYAKNDHPFGKHGSQRVANVYLLQGPGSCVPCGRQGCLDHRNSRSNCLLALSPNDVMRAIDSMVTQHADMAANGAR